LEEYLSVESLAGRVSLCPQQFSPELIGVTLPACAAPRTALHPREGVPFESSLHLGIAPSEAYAESLIQLTPGDRLTFLSDGVVEAQSPTGELFGFDRTRELSTRSAEQIARTAQAYGQQDDITVLAVTFAPAHLIA
jgi:stage II sporulation SpoE-like protein